LADRRQWSDSIRKNHPAKVGGRRSVGAVFLPSFWIAASFSAFSSLFVALKQGRQDGGGTYRRVLCRKLQNGFAPACLGAIN